MVTIDVFGLTGREFRSIKVIVPALCFSLQIRVVWRYLVPSAAAVVSAAHHGCCTGTVAGIFLLGGVHGCGYGRDPLPRQLERSLFSNEAPTNESVERSLPAENRCLPAQS